MSPGIDPAKRAAITAFLADSANAGLSNRKVADALGTSEQTIRRFKLDPTGDRTVKAPKPVPAEVSTITTDRVVLDRAEQQRRDALESIIEKGLQAFIEVGNALLDIRDEGLYLSTHDSFDSYVEDRWGMGKRHANRMIAATEVVSNLGPIGPKPTNESQVRPLVSLPPGEQAEAWDEALATAPNGKPTAKHVEEIVDRRLGKSPKASKPSPRVVREAEDESDPADLADEPGEEFPTDEPPPKPPGKSMVNGELVDDPPDIASQRARGLIGPNVVPVITIADPASQAETSPPDEAVHVPESDEEWLARFPARAKLGEVCREKFDRDALAYRRGRDKAVNAIRAAFAGEKLSTSGRLPPYLYRVRRFLKTDGPSGWIVCAPMEHGGCGGTGWTPLGACPECFGNGYRING